MIRTLLTAALILAAPLTAQACQYGTCHHCRRNAIQQFGHGYAASNTYFFVGAPVRVEAIVKKELESNPEYQEFKRFKAWQSLQSEPQESRQTTGLLSQSCGRCHSGATPDGQLLLDGSAPIQPETFVRIFQVLRGIDVPDEMKAVIANLGEKKGPILEEVSRLVESVGESAPDTPPLPAPPPEQQGRSPAARTEPSVFFGG